MKKRLTIQVILTVFLVAPLALSAQKDWVSMMNSENRNLYEIEKAVKDWWGNRPTTEKGYKPIARWLDLMKSYADENGNIDRSHEVSTFQEYMRLHQNSSRNGGNWSLVGPIAATPTGMGRVNALAFHPTDADIMYAGTPGGGLWKTTNRGLSWINLTDHLPSLGVSDVVVHPTNPDILYMGTGDNDGQNTPCFGILKSTDGGNTWTNVFPASNNGLYFEELLIHPTNPDTIIAAGTRGVDRSYDGGANWTNVLNANLEDIVFHPTNPSIMYAVGFGGNTGYYKTVDGGDTWTQGATGLSGSSVGGGSSGRMMVAVSADEPDYVYVLNTHGSGGGFDFEGLYLSTNAGQSFTQKSNTSANLNFRQSWYDLALSVNPANADNVFMGDAPCVRSSDGGTNWGNALGSGSRRMHVDIHDIEFSPVTGELWVGSDGGVYQASGLPLGTGYTARNNNLSITQFYRLGTSVHDYGSILAGSQDNGTMRYDGSLWVNQFGADGMECLFSWKSPLFMAYSWQNGNLIKNDFGVQSSWIRAQNINETGAWTTPFVQDPNDGNTYYAGFQSIWKTTDGTNWNNLSGSLGGATLSQIELPQFAQGFFIFAASSGRFHRSLDKGVSWESFPFKDGQGNFMDLAVDPERPNTIYASHSNGVWKTTDAGENWTDISGSLPNLPVETIVYQHGSKEALYAGTSVGIYYRDSTLGDWEPFMDNLPNVRIRELEISYCFGKIRAATYGRGVWESDLYPNGYRILSADFDIDQGTGVNDASIVANVNGGFGPFTYRWSNGSTTATASGLSIGQYDVKITDKNHCVYENTVTLGAAAIDDQLIGIKDLKAFPNPVNNQLFVELMASQPGTLDLTLLNAVGQQAYHQRVETFPGKNAFSLPTQELAAGVYVLEVSQGDKKAHVKLVKQ